MHTVKEMNVQTCFKTVKKSQIIDYNYVKTVNINKDRKTIESKIVV